jgi:hypothetical protein
MKPPLFERSGYRRKECASNLPAGPSWGRSCFGGKRIHQFHSPAAAKTVAALHTELPLNVGRIPLFLLGPLFSNFSWPPNSDIVDLCNRLRPVSYDDGIEFDCRVTLYHEVRSYFGAQS